MSELSGKAGGVYTDAEVVESCENDWTKDDGATTAAKDGTDFKVGTYSVKIVIPTETVQEKLCAHKVIDLNLSDRDVIYLWVKDSVGFAKDTMALLLDDTAECTSVLKTLNFPAIASDTWTKVALDLGDASGLIDILAVGIEQVADLAAHNIWVDDIQAISIVDGIKSWTIDYTLDTLDVTDFENGAATNAPRAFLPGLSGWSGSFEGYKDGVPKALSFSSAVKLILAESATAGQNWIGDAYITGIHPNASVDGLITYTYDFTGTGELTEAAV